MKKLPLLTALSLLALVGACDQKPDEAAARERRPELKPPTQAVVSRWKQTDSGTRVYGMIIEQEAGRVLANLYALDDGEGLVIREKEAQGKFYPDKRAIIFPLYNPAAVAPEKWIAEGGPHVIVPWEPAGTNLLCTRIDSTQTNTWSFVRLESVGPTYPVNTSR